MVVTVVVVVAEAALRDSSVSLKNCCVKTPCPSLPLLPREWQTQTTCNPEGDGTGVAHMMAQSLVVLKCTYWQNLSWPHHVVWVPDIHHICGCGTHPVPLCGCEQLPSALFRVLVTVA